MGKFDWGRFGSALATNVGNTGQQFFMNKMLQEEEDKRAYTKANTDMLIAEHQRTGNNSIIEQLRTSNNPIAKSYVDMVAKSPVKTPQQKFDEETRMGINRDLERQQFGADPRPQPPKEQQPTKVGYIVKAYESGDPEKIKIAEKLMGNDSALNNLAKAVLEQSKARKVALDIEGKELDNTMKKRKADEWRPPQQQFDNIFLPAVGALHDSWKAIPKEKKGPGRAMFDTWLKEGVGYERLKDDPDFARYNVFYEDIKISLARLYEPTASGSVQRLSDKDIERYANMALSYTTQDPLTADISIDALKEVVARRLGAKYVSKYSPEQRMESGAMLPEELGKVGGTPGGQNMGNLPEMLKALKTKDPAGFDLMMKELSQ